MSAIHLAPTLTALPDPPRRALARLGEIGCGAVQLGATQPGLRPRDLDRSGRRDLVATLRRLELALAGIDLWIPVDHFTVAAHVDRAVAAVCAAIDLAADVGGCPVSVTLPPEIDGLVVAQIVEHAEHRGVGVADHAVPPSDVAGLGVGIDPAAWLADGRDPIAAVLEHARRLCSVRVVDLLTTGLRGPPRGGSGSEGRLDLLAYRASVEIARPARPVVVDLRQWTDPWAGLTATCEAWEAAAP